MLDTFTMELPASKGEIRGVTIDDKSFSLNNKSFLNNCDTTCSTRFLEVLHALLRHLERRLDVDVHALVEALHGQAGGVLAEAGASVVHQHVQALRDGEGTGGAGVC